VNPTMTRRTALKRLGQLGVAAGAGAALLPAWMPRLAFAAPGQAPRGDVLVCVFLRGGVDGLSVLVPHGDGADYYDPRPTQGVPEPGSGAGAAFDLGGGLGLHPALAPVKELYDSGHAAIVAACGSIDPSRSHFEAMRFMEQGVPGSKTVATGWLGRHLQSAAWANPSPLRAIGLGTIVQASLRGAPSALAFESIAGFHVDWRADESAAVQAALRELYRVDAPVSLLDQQGGLVLDTIATLATVGAGAYVPAHGAAYPADEYFGTALRQVAQLVKADVGLEVACVDTGGWDTHETQGTNGGYLADRLDGFARALAAFYTDLGDRMNGVTVVTMSEFGRRVGENGSQGTDHGHGNTMFVLGGGVNGGQVYGSWPTLAPDQLDDGDLRITTDYRHVLGELCQRRLHNPALDQVFPGFAVTPLGVCQA
jgi:uncharacterized protein (DUF1501 family)